MKGHQRRPNFAGGSMTSVDELKELARRCRVHIINMVHRAQAGHPGGSLSEIDLLAALYKTQLRSPR
jgi:transketolase